MAGFTGAHGSGRWKPSPDGWYGAHAELLRATNPLSPKRGMMWTELSIERRYRPPEEHDVNGIAVSHELIRLVVTPPGTKDAAAYENDDRLVRWSDDSKTAIFRLPNATVTVTPSTDEVKNAARPTTATRRVGSADQPAADQ